MHIQPRGASKKFGSTREAEVSFNSVAKAAAEATSWRQVLRLLRGMRPRDLGDGMERGSPFRLHICICTCICIYIYTYIHVCIYVYIYIDMHIHVYV